MSGIIYIVSTPIGNLGDITLRALSILKEADLILCEDTRVTGKLLDHYSLKTPVLSYHQHSGPKRMREIEARLKQGQKLALVTDAGTPGISDPGNELIQHLICNPTLIAIVPVPGVSAVITALSISGFPTDKFSFLGFPPHKKKRKKFFTAVAESRSTVVFYESSHRIKKSLRELAKIMPANTPLCVCRELTKKFETVYRGTVEEILKLEMPEKGEFVVLARL